ncbi:MAG: hypothetical protein JWN44_1299 [Myxococcales bacterium]|nr:hypothetical protein [Myxococcales bacterium]
MRAMTSWLLIAVAVPACASRGDSPPNAPDLSSGSVGAESVCGFANGTNCGGAGSANRGCAPDACNWCDCGPGWGGTNMAGCTAVGCPPPPDAGADYLRCHDQSECPPGYACIFNAGCDQTLGQCNAQTFYCPHDPRTFTLCDCDGNTVTDAVSSCAPDRRYAQAGACP